jgi:hypothetical protein
MGLGHFVVGAGSTVHDRKLSVDQNHKPDVGGTNGFVTGTQNVSTMNGVIILSFERDLAPKGGNPIDASKPFRVLWAHGVVGAGTGFDAVQYHGSNRGSILVDMKAAGNCDEATLALFKGKKESTVASPPTPKTAGPGNMTAAAPTPKAKGKMMKGAKGKMMKAAKGKKAVAECDMGKVKCTEAHQASGANCIVGMCFTPAKGQESKPKAAAEIACGSWQTRCTENVQKRMNCVLGTCVANTESGSCGPTQVACTAAYQAKVNCVIGACIDRRQVGA